MANHAVFGAILAVLIPLALVLFHRIGELRYAVIFLAAAAAAVLVVPRVPGSPIVCLAARPAHGNPCAHAMGWVMGLCFLAPLAIAGLGTRRRRPRRRRGPR
jgi:hypothetical protein